MSLADYLFEVSPGSLEEGNPSAFVAKLPAVYRDLLQLGRVALEVLPKDLKTLALLAAYSPLKAPTRDDKDSAGDAIYTWNDIMDCSKGLSHASEIAFFDATKEFAKLEAKVFEDKGKAITYLVTRNTATAQEIFGLTLSLRFFGSRMIFPRFFN